MAKELSINGKDIKVQAANVSCTMNINGTDVTNLQDALDLLVADANGDEPPNPLYLDGVKTMVVNDNDVAVKLENVVYNAVIGDIPVTNAEQAITRLKSFKRYDVGAIRVLSWNIGHFAMGNAAASYVSPALPDKGYGDFSEGETYTPNGNEAVQRQRWNTRMTDIAPDIMLFSEYNGIFVKNSDTNTHDDLFGRFCPYCVVGTSNGYSHNALYNRRFPFQYAWNGELSEELSLTGGGGRYLLKGKVVMGNTEVVVAVTHLDPSYESTRAQQISAIIDDLSSYSHIILGGDFNTTADAQSEFAPFTTAGYTMANCGSFGVKMTWPSTGWQRSYDANPGSPYCAIDNIIVKGFSINNVEIIDESHLTDHCGVVADLTII